MFVDLLETCQLGSAVDFILLGRIRWPQSTFDRTLGRWGWYCYTAKVEVTMVTSHFPDRQVVMAYSVAGRRGTS